MTKRSREFLVAAIALLAVAVMTMVETHLNSVPRISSGHVFVFALINFNIVLLIFVIFLVIRNIFKILMERKSKILGARLRTKLIAAFVSLTIIPTMVLFFTSLIFLDRSMEGWLSVQVKRAIQESMNVANIYYQEAGGDALHYANFIANEITQRRLLREGNLDILKSLLDESMSLFRLSAVEVFSAQGEELVKIISPKLGVSTLPDPESYLVRSAMEGKPLNRVVRSGKADLIEGIVPIRSSFNAKDIVGVLVVDYYIPESLSGRLGIVESSYSDYIESLKLKGPIKTGYIITLTSITLLVIFSATWFGINISKGLTTPIEQLVEGTQRISRGDLGFTIDIDSDDELGILVQDFNKMVDDLNSSRKDLESAYNELAYRTRYISTVLNNISTGVISVGSRDTITMVNPAAQEMISIKTEKVIGRSYAEVLKEEHLPIVSELVDTLKKNRGISAHKEISLSIAGRRVVLMVHASMLYDDNNEYMGMVVVFDDLTELQRMQRVAAWREVARRIAHEVKNPLTPIQLSAQRLRRRYMDRLGEDDGVFDECTRLIVDQVDEMKRLVDEFSAFAKMPSSQPVPDNLNEVVQDTVALYRQAHTDFSFELELDERLPQVDIDRPQMSRAVGNLIENAAMAVKESGAQIKRIIARTSYDRLLQIATLEIIDSGPGIPANIKERMFEPYFSTKKGGTGLGLVIVKSIVTDHGGFIRVRDNKPSGTIIAIEFPVKERA